MLKKIFYISKRFYVRENVKKSTNLLQGSSKNIYNKLFLSHIIKEDNSQWFMKDCDKFQYIAHHPTMTYAVAIFTENALPIGTDLYVIGLSPLKEWLFKDKNKVIFFKDSYLATSTASIVNKEADNFLDVVISANFLSDFLSKVRPTGYIVKSVDLSTHPVLSGLLQTENDQLVFIPRHRGIPNLLLPQNENCQSTNSNISKKESFCEMIKWDYDSPAFGRLLQSCPINYVRMSIFDRSVKSKTSNLDLNEAIPELLKSFNLKDEPFSSTVQKSLMQFSNFHDISDEEMKKRENFIDNCVISIDPEDAKDIDDALHIEKLSDGNYEVGVHIADVSYYVIPETLIDSEALARATSVYLIHKVIPMLPEILSEKLCSLNPDENKLTFSVIFVLSPDGTIISERFVKSVVKPKLRLSYDEANKMIAGDIESLAMKDHSVFNSAAESVQELNKIAKMLRDQRIRNGALILDKVELKFATETTETVSDNLEPSITLPSSFSTKVRGASSFLIEEWMLLANQAAARLLYQHAVSEPNSRVNIGSFLRKHSPPDKKQIYNMITASKAAGLKLESVKSTELQQQILELKSSDPLKSLFMSYLSYFNMQLAMYFCAEKTIHGEIFNVNDADSPLHHFGLNVPLYTHFTSPIRRYADLLVHRQLSAIISNKNDCGTNSESRLIAANNSNAVRLSAKRMYEELQSLYMAAYLNREGWRLTKALILTEHNNSLKIFLPFSGIVLFMNFSTFAPWACEVTKQQIDETKPITFQLKYNLDNSKYKIEETNGFIQYVYQWPDRTTETEDQESDNTEQSLDDRIDEIRQEQSKEQTVNTGDNVDPEKYGVFEINLSEPIHGLLFCMKTKLKLSIELPFPDQLSQLKEDAKSI